jgi:hypothetical protein
MDAKKIASGVDCHGKPENGKEDRDDTPRFMGLCSICEIREACRFPKPEGGVWHCEEYE